MLQGTAKKNRWIIFINITNNDINIIIIIITFTIVVVIVIVIVIFVIILMHGCAECQTGYFTSEQNEQLRYAVQHEK